MTINFFGNISINCVSHRLLEMRMPRTSSFSVRDILDLPQIKTGTNVNTDATVSAALPSQTGLANTDLYLSQSKREI